MSPCPFQTTKKKKFKRRIKTRIFCSVWLAPSGYHMPRHNSPCHSRRLPVFSVRFVCVSARCTVSARPSSAVSPCFILQAGFSQCMMMIVIVIIRQQPRALPSVLSCPSYPPILGGNDLPRSKQVRVAVRRGQHAYHAARVPVDVPPFALGNDVVGLARTLEQQHRKTELGV